MLSVSQLHGVNGGEVVFIYLEQVRYQLRASAKASMGQLIQIERTTESSEVEPDAYWDLLSQIGSAYDLTTST